MGIGLFISSATAVYGVIAGGAALQSTILKATVPLLGDLKFVTSSIFDIGVYLIVIGLVLDVLRSMGAELDRQGVLERCELDAKRPATSGGPAAAIGRDADDDQPGAGADHRRAVRGRRLPDAVPEPDPGDPRLPAGRARDQPAAAVHRDGRRAADRRARPTDGEPMADPIPQALILTSIVISLAVSTFLLAMAYRNYKVTREPETRGRPEDDEFADAEPGRW